MIKYLRDLWIVAVYGRILKCDMYVNEKDIATAITLSRKLKIATSIQHTLKESEQIPPGKCGFRYTRTRGETGVWLSFENFISEASE